MKPVPSIVDLVADESFQKWVLTNDEAARRHWQRRRFEHPELESTIEEARQWLLSLRFEEHTPETGRMQAVWNRIQAENRSYPQPTTAVRLPYWRQVAAVISLLLLSGIVWLLRTPAYTTYSTAYGKTMNIVLPDSSQVTLNANSTLRYRTSWDEEAVSRKVWLVGEAFFTVNRQLRSDDPSTHAKFTVHTDDLAVEVLGTTFNVNTHRRATQVILEHGEVRLTLSDAASAKYLLMQSGDLVSYQGQGESLVRKQVSTQELTSWKEGELIFRDQSLGQIANRLEDTYGYQITFENSAIRREKFTVSIPTDEVELLFPMLSRAFSLKMTRQGNHITFTHDQ